MHSSPTPSMFDALHVIINSFYPIILTILKTQPRDVYATHNRQHLHTNTSCTLKRYHFPSSGSALPKIGKETFEYLETAEAIFLKLESHHNTKPLQ